MKKVILLLCSIMLSAGVAFADSCFIVKENSKVLKTEGDCDKRYAPNSCVEISANR
jgi:beta-lactamase class D